LGLGRRCGNPASRGEDAGMTINYRIVSVVLIILAIVSAIFGIYFTILDTGPMALSIVSVIGMVVLTFWGME
jgi:hypothetical protein